MTSDAFLAWLKIHLCLIVVALLGAIATHPTLKSSS